MSNDTVSGLGFIAVAALVMAAGNVHSSPITIAGGPLDTTIANDAVYVGVPARATVVPGAACRAAKTYVEHVRAGRFSEVADLYAADAVVLEPTGGMLRAHEEIDKFYTETIARKKPDVIDVAYAGDNTDCMVAIASRITIAGAPRYRLASVDHFTLNTEGKFSRMVAFSRPPAVHP